MTRSSRHRKQYSSVHESMADLLGRDDLQRINRLRLWSFFGTVEQVKQFAAQPRAQKRAFFDRFEHSMAEEADRLAAADADHRLFDLPQDATPEQIQQRYRELALAFHPDRDEGDHEVMQEINLAYQRLLGRD